MKFVKRLLLAIGLFGIFYPVLQVYIPLSEFVDLNGSMYYLVGTALVAVFFPYWFMWIPIQIGFLIVCYRYYFPSDLSGMDWLNNEFSQIMTSVGSFFNGRANIFPTNVSLILILGLIAVSGYLLIVRSRPTASILAAVFYLMILQVFTTYDYFTSIVQILGFGIILYGIARITPTAGWKRGLGSVIVIVGTGFGLTFLAVKVTEEMVPQQRWIEQRAMNVNRRLDEAGLFDLVDYYNSGGQFTRMGYDEDDTVLGGPVQQNFDPVFAAFDNQPHYWRISTRDVYTGVGWESPEYYSVLPVSYGFVELEDSEKTVDVMIARESNFPYFPYTYGMVDAVVEGSAFEFVMPESQLHSPNVDGDVPYTLTLVDKEFNFTELNAVNIESTIGFEEYLAVPESVPQRVWNLAAELTGGDGTMYEKVRALEEYLSSDGRFRYSLREARVLPDGYDYVDHFLFESQVGYCDNFSTAMVVMARMAGIPARWAKGFNSGTAAFSEDGSPYYAVTNANAHSWPEIFFPEAGWVPFEPTPTFQQPLTYADTLAKDDGLEPDDGVLPIESMDAESEASKLNNVNTESQVEVPVISEESESRNWTRFTGVMLLIVIGIAVVWRRRWYPLIATWLLKVPFLDSYRIVLWLFSLILPFDHSQTLRQYFSEIADLVPMHSDIIARYVAANEQALYGSSDRDANNDSLYTDMITVYRDILISKEKSSF